MTFSATIETRPTAPTAGAPDDSRPDLRVDSLDGLRTIAIFMVVLYHLHVPYFTGGFIGVNVFYPLSGYLITSILLREREKTGRIQLGKFWLRRVLRLYPGLVALVIASIALWSLVGGYKGANVDALTAALLSLSYISNIGRWLWHKSIGVLSQTWSLGMEEQFYLVWPPILALIALIKARRTPLIWTLVGIVIASSVSGWLFYAPRGGSATPDEYFSPLLNVGPLLCGVILALVLKDVRVRNIFAGWVGSVATLVGALTIFGLELAITSGWEKNVLTFALELPLAGIASTVLLAGLVCKQSLLAVILSTKPIAWFGRNCSYSLYLWHTLVIALVVPLLPGAAGIAAAVVASVLVSVAMHYAIEGPVEKLKRRLAPSSKPARRSESERRSLELASDTQGV
jgi:peptidoglycan/LPS O-acetylase OafA/YrhL